MHKHSLRRCWFQKTFVLVCPSFPSLGSRWETHPYYIQIKPAYQTPHPTPPHHDKVSTNTTYTSRIIPVLPFPYVE
ncbi:hypothetical protein P167DRAFT_97033 [Morchella conica CCBAS932]|uniref:Uncharacterized protein n=1 Tax=Morchella conica CCBAS932 TaxID=1392247 RepID=A0A3N4KT42_9PEZI|nr:hypothetical protein P167DRAFT_97033 [Morchella conica CCBAS932]